MRRSTVALCILRPALIAESIPADALHLQASALKLHVVAASTAPFDVLQRIAVDITGVELEVESHLIVSAASIRLWTHGSMNPSSLPCQKGLVLPFEPFLLRSVLIARFIEMEGHCPAGEAACTPAF